MGISVLLWKRCFVAEDYHACLSARIDEGADLRAQYLAAAHG
jgi:hypothetical protein